MCILVAVISRTAEQDLLRRYEAELAEARDRAEEARRDMDALEQIVGGMRARLQQPEPADLGATVVIGGTVIAGDAPNGRPNLTASIRQVMSDGQPRNVAEILAVLQEQGRQPVGDRTRQRGKIANRLGELKDRGQVERRGRGVYALRSRNGSAPE